MAACIISPRNKSKARSIAQELLREKLLSVDSEGVQLGKDGPLTLLQIGTLDGRVYLFDVMVNEQEQDKDFFKDTGLGRILASSEIIKVIHSCSSDSAALFHQFGVRLQNVFDTQVAHLVIEEHKGRQLPTRLKLAEMCGQYSKNAEVYEGKDELKITWNKRVGNFWAIRPMTDEMIQYASCDVMALIPEVYETQNRYIMDNDLDEIYQDRIKEEIELEINPDQKQRRHERNHDRSFAILTTMEEQHSNTIVFASLTDQDEKKAVEVTRWNKMGGFSDKIKRLKQESMLIFLEELEQDFLTPESFSPHRGVWFILDEIKRNGTSILKEKANLLKQRLCEMILQDIETKYSPETSLQSLNSLDCQVLKSIRPIGDEQGQMFTETILSLHWKVIEKEFDSETEKVKADADYDAHMPFNRLTFFIYNDTVPHPIQLKAIALKDLVEERVLRAIAVKYTADSDIADLSSNTRAILGGLRVCKNRYHKVVVALHWKLSYENLCGDLERLQCGEKSMSAGFKRKLNFLKSYPSVPCNVRAKAMEILSSALSGRR